MVIDINLPEIVDDKVLKEELAELIFEYEDLINRINPLLEHKYISTFGFWEVELLKLETEFRMVKRKIQLTQIQINLQEEIDLDKINKTLENEFKKFEEMLKRHEKELINNLNMFRVAISQEEFKDMRRKYKVIIKTLHPDLNKELTEYQKQLFVLATEAYKNGDVETINSIYEIIKGKDNINIDKKSLEEQISIMKEKIERCKEDFPYNKKELLEDPIQTQEYIDFLKDSIETCKSLIALQKKAFEELIKDGTWKNPDGYC